MPTTSTLIKFGLYVLEVKQDGSLSAADLQPFSNLNDLRTGTATNRPYASYEPDYWLLDGNYKFLPADPSSVHLGMMSASISDASGDFDTPPVLTITFSKTHSAPSLILRFGESSGDYADDINIAYYDAVDGLIRSDDYAPADVVFSTDVPVDDFKKIVITFNSTNRPYRYLRLTAIDYGDLLTLDSASIKSASAVEEIDQLSGEVRYCTLDLRLYSSDAQFSILNPTGYYASLADRQPLLVYEQVDNEQVFIGQYYLDDWENASATEIELRCIDRLGVLDTQTYRGGIWTTPIAVEDLLEEILADIAPYELDDDLLGITLAGWLPICSYREALQQIGFAVGASVNCARSGVVQIRATKLASVETATDTIPRSQQGAGGGPVILLPLVTGVEVTSHDYTAVATSQQVFSGSLAAGDYEFKFSQPLHDLSISGATITESGANYALINVATSGTVTLSGQIYAETTRVTAVYTPDTGSLVENIKRVTDATLVSAANAGTVAQRIYDYFQQRYKKKVRLFAPTNLQPGQVVTVDTLQGGDVRGVIEKMDSDLTGGFVVKAEIVGVLDE